MSTTIRVEVAGAELVVALLQEIQKRARNLRPAMRTIGQEVREVSMRAFKAQANPADAQPWPALSTATILARTRRQFRSKGGLYTKNGKRTRAGVLGAMQSAQALLNTGALRNSIQVGAVTKSSVTVGTNLPYAAIHQFGGMAGRGRKVRIPARPFMGLDDSARANIVNTLRSYVLGNDAP